MKRNEVCYLCTIKTKDSYNESSLFAVVVFYKVIMNNEVGNIVIAPGGNTGLGFCDPLVTACSPASYIANSTCFTCISL
jgi:hypothetical protein